MDDAWTLPRIAVTVDAVVLAPAGSGLGVLLIRRGRAPFEGAWALPGGFVEEDEDLEPAARRELEEETGVRLPGPLAQLGAFGAPGRDPRGRTVSVVFWTLERELPGPRAGDDAAHAELVPVEEVRAGRVTLAFDHREILERALEAAAECGA
jgi:8-oxo-dGTP diphosphatase